MELALEMEKEDWRRLFEYAHAANEIKHLFEQAEAAGKQQVSIKQSAVDRFLALKLPPDFWLKLGSLIGQKLKEEQGE